MNATLFCCLTCRPAAFLAIWDGQPKTQPPFLNFKGQPALLIIVGLAAALRVLCRKCEKKIADEETAQKIIAALEGESIKYETYFKLIIATGMRRGECCGLKWCDIDWEQRSIHICRNAVKVTDEEIFVKEPKTRAGDRYVYFSAEMESLLREYQKECRYITETYDQRQLTADDFLFRRQGARLPMTPTTFTYRFKLDPQEERPTAGAERPFPPAHRRQSDDRGRHGCGHGGGHPRPQPALHHAGHLHPRLRQE